MANVRDCCRLVDLVDGPCRLDYRLELLRFGQNPLRHQLLAGPLSLVPAAVVSAASRRPPGRSRHRRRRGAGVRDRVCAGGRRHRCRHLRAGPPRARAGRPRNRHRRARAGAVLLRARQTAWRARCAPHLSNRAARLARIRVGAEAAAHRVRPSDSRRHPFQLEPRRHSGASEGIQRAARSGPRRRVVERDAALPRKSASNGFGLVTHGNASVDPYKATIGLARAAVARGAKIFEQSPVTRIRPRRRTVDIRTEGGVVTASKVVVATGYPTDDFKPLRRRFARSDAYVVLTGRAAGGCAARDDAAGR